MAKRRKFRFKAIISEEEAEELLDALQDVMNGLKTRRRLNDITIEEVTEADGPTRLPGAQEIAGSAVAAGISLFAACSKL